MAGRKHYSEDQILSTLRRVESGEKVRDVCRSVGVSEQTYFRWKSKYGGMSKSELARVKQLESENARLKRLLAEKILDNDALRDVIAKKL